MADGLKLARDLAIRQSGELVLQQLNQLLEELDRQLLEAERMKARL